MKLKLRISCTWNHMNYVGKITCNYHKLSTMILSIIPSENLSRDDDQLLKHCRKFDYSNINYNRKELVQYFHSLRTKNLKYSHICLFFIRICANSLTYVNILSLDAHMWISSLMWVRTVSYTVSYSMDEWNDDVARGKCKKYY